jgi:hypothetical protein
MVKSWTNTTGMWNVRGVSETAKFLYDLKNWESLCAPVCICVCVRVQEQL